MGLQVIYTSGITAGFTIILSIVAIQMPLHSKPWKYMSVETTAVSLRVSHCGLNRTLLNGKAVCDSLNGFHFLTEAKHYFCSETYLDSSMVSTSCTGLQYASLLGLILYLFVASSVILRCVGLWIMHRFIVRPRTHFRYFTRVVFLSGAAIVMAGLMLYIIALRRLDRMFEGGVRNQYAISIGTGYIVLWFDVALQFCAGGLCVYGQLRDEARLSDLKALEQFGQEMAAAAGPTGMYPSAYPAYNPGQDYGRGPSLQQPSSQGAGFSATTGYSSTAPYGTQVVHYMVEHSGPTQGAAWGHSPPPPAWGGLGPQGEFSTYQTYA
mmetsp:Transcript_25881/g.72187  ORF Transcript_25881/g.72187 Transcript_25881/m.72187 type:complete len:323 (-) Transcript_25881:110-1078(-)|eukprot:CAMPEP_0117529936 /NCGR_PEP_ID=MMETSP0784-20121206/38085_1 /TAXON_ID=39447 /ORGANISM="" /LENGTH=322 /DNA_ID=CAMNT_0005326265 /DNA_START=56 /DNA_END=1024 /DNA_ORIENTATION=-